MINIQRSDLKKRTRLLCVKQAPESQRQPTKLHLHLWRLTVRSCDQLKCHYHKLDWFLRWQMIWNCFTVAVSLTLVFLSEKRQRNQGYYRENGQCVRANRQPAAESSPSWRVRSSVSCVSSALAFPHFTPLQTDCCMSKAKREEDRGGGE